LRNPLRDPNRGSVISAKRRAARVLTHPRVGRLASRIFGGRIPSVGVRVDTRSALVTDSSRAQLLWRIYEGAEHRLVRRHLRPADTIVELGTSIGFLSSVALQTARGTRRFVGVEANPGLIALAQRNIRDNAPGTEATVVHGAVDYSVAPGTPVPFSVGTQHTGARVGSDATSSFLAPAMTLSGVLADHDVVDYTLLADIEGGEAGLLLHDVEALQHCRQAVLELHDTALDGRRITVADLREAAQGAGFRIVDSYGPVVVLTR
jgi:FkbM family methyltransferase